MARRKQGLAVALLELLAKLPWWLGVGLAVFSYLAFHELSIMELRSTGLAKDLSGVVIKQALKTLGVVCQYIFPVIFLVGAWFSLDKRQASKNHLGKRDEPMLVSDDFKDCSATRIRPGDDLYAYWKSPREDARPVQLNLELLRAIDWKRFEEVCAEYFRICGFHAATQSHGPDGGIDVRLYAPQDRSTLVNIVQCKRWSNPVGPKSLRELLGVMTANKLSRGIFVTSSVFNDEATQFAIENKIHLIDGEQFLGKILGRSPEEQTRLLKVATEGDYLTPSCPNCGIKLVRRERRSNSASFWGCANFPKCRYILNS